MDKDLLDQEIKRAAYHLEAHKSLYRQHHGKGELAKAENSRLRAGTWQAIAAKLAELNRET